MGATSLRLLSLLQQEGDFSNLLKCVAHDAYRKALSDRSLVSDVGYAVRFALHDLTKPQKPYTQTTLFGTPLTKEQVEQVAEISWNVFHSCLLAQSDQKPKELRLRVAQITLDRDWKPLFFSDSP